MPPLKIKEGTIKGFKYSDNEYEMTLKFAKDVVGSITQKGMEYYCNRPISIEVNEVQQELDLDKPKKVKPEDKKAEIIEINTDAIKKSKIEQSEVGPNLGQGKIKNAFEHEGKLFVAFGIRYNQGDNKHSEYDAVELIDVKDYTEPIYTLKQKEKLPKEEQRPYHKGIKVTYNKKEYILGDPVMFLEVIKTKLSEESSKLEENSTDTNPEKTKVKQAS